MVLMKMKNVVKMMIMMMMMTMTMTIMMKAMITRMMIKIVKMKNHDDIDDDEPCVNTEEEG